MRTAQEKKKLKEELKEAGLSKLTADAVVEKLEAGDEPGAMALLDGFWTRTAKSCLHGFTKVGNALTVSITSSINCKKEKTDKGRKREAIL